MDAPQSDASPPITVATERGAIEVAADGGLIHLTASSPDLVLNRHQADELVHAILEAGSR